MSNRNHVAKKKRLSDDEFDRRSSLTDTLRRAVIFGQAFSTFTKALEKALAPANLTVSQFLALRALLSPSSTMTPTQISRVITIETQSVSALLDRLQERKLVRRRRSRTDKRIVEVAVTEEGKRLMERVNPVTNKLITDVFRDSLSRREQQQLLRVARKIRDMSVARQEAKLEDFEVAEEQITGVTKISPDSRQRSRSSLRGQQK